MPPLHHGSYATEITYKSQIYNTNHKIIYNIFLTLTHHTTITNTVPTSIPSKTTPLTAPTTDTTSDDTPRATGGGVLVTIGAALVLIS